MKMGSGSCSENPICFCRKCSATVITAIAHKKHPSIYTVQKIHKEPKEIRKSSKIADSVVNYQPNIVGQETELEEKKVWLQQIYGSEQCAEISECHAVTTM
jgi:hypothetical protein